MIALLALILLQDPPTDAQTVERWVEHLASSDVETRENAVLELLKFGEKGDALLKKHEAHPDPEVRTRVKEIRRRLASVERLKGFQIVQRALEKDSKSADWQPALRQWLETMVDSLKEHLPAEKLKELQ